MKLRPKLLANGLPLAVLAVLLGTPRIVSAQENVTRTRIHVQDEGQDPALEAAQQAMDQKNYPAAAQAYKDYLAKKPDDAAAHFGLGNAYASMNQTQDARAEYEKAISLDPKLDVAYINLGLILVNTDPGAAAARFEKAAELLPGQARPKFLLGWAYERSGSLAQAIEQYQAAEKLDDKNSDIHFALGRALMAAKKPVDAEAEFRAAITTNPANGQAHLGLSQSLMAQKKFDAAADELGTYLQTQPNDKEARLSHALALATDGKNEEALAELDRASAAGLESISALKLRSQILFQMKRYDDAIPVLEKAATLAPQDPDIPARLGHLYLEKHDYPNAVRELLIAFKMSPNANDVLGEIVAAEYLGKNYDAALKALDLLSQREDLPAGTIFIRAACYDKLGQAAAALDSYKKFLELNKDENNDMYFEATARVRFLEREVKDKKK